MLAAFYVGELVLPTNLPPLCWTRSLHGADEYRYLLLTKLGKRKTDPFGVCLSVERMKGIEPSTPAWEAEVLPLNYIRIEEITSNNI